MGPGTGTQSCTGPSERTRPEKEAVMPQRHRPELSESVTGEPLVGYRRTPRTFRADRVCEVSGCTTAAVDLQRRLRVLGPRTAPRLGGTPVEGRRLHGRGLLIRRAPGMGVPGRDEAGRGRESSLAPAVPLF